MYTKIINVLAPILFIRLSELRFIAKLTVVIVVDNYIQNLIFL